MCRSRGTRATSIETTLLPSIHFELYDHRSSPKFFSVKREVFFSPATHNAHQVHFRGIFEVEKERMLIFFCKREPEIGFSGNRK